MTVKLCNNWGLIGEREITGVEVRRSRIVRGMSVSKPSHRSFPTLAYSHLEQRTTKEGFGQ